MASMVEHTRVLLVGPVGAGRTAALLRMGRALENRRVVALSPTHAGAQALRRRGRVEAHSISELARTLLEVAPEGAGLPAQGLHVLSGLSRRTLLRRACDQLRAQGQIPALGPLLDGPGAIAALLPQWDILAAALDSAHPDAVSVAAGAVPLAADLARCFARYLHLCQMSGMVGLQELEARACDALRSPALRAALPWDAVLVDDLDALRPQQLTLLSALIEALAERQPPVIAACSSLDTPAGDEQLALVRRWAERHELLFSEIEARSLAGGALLHMLDARVPAGGPQQTILEMARPDEEAHAIVQDIVADLAGSGRSPSDYAIVCWSEDTLRALRRVAPSYGLPLAGATARRIGANPLLVPLRAGALLLAGEPLPEDLEQELLRGPLLALSEAQAHALGRVSGGLLALLEGRSAPPGGQELGWTGTLAAALVNARARHQHWQALLVWLAQSGALELLFNTEALPLTRAERDICGRQVERALGVLADLERATSLTGAALTREDLPQALDEALSIVAAEELELGGEAVAIWRSDDLFGRRAATVYLAGLDETALPRRLPALQPLDDAALARAFGALPGFVRQQRQHSGVQLERARRELSRALGCALEQLVLSYSSHGLDRKPRLPSPLFLELLGRDALHDGRLQLPADAPQAMLRKGLEQGNPPHALRPAELANVPPAGLIPLLSLLDAPPAAHDRHPSPRFSDAGFRASATAINTYLMCPRRYFYGRLLSLDDDTGEALAVGHVFHALLERLFDEWDAISREKLMRRGMAILRDLWPHYAGKLGPPLHQASYRRMIRAGLADLIKLEAEKIRPLGRTPIAREHKFQLTWTDGTLITGAIDRIDRLKDGRYAIIDYKTGAKSPSLGSLLRQFIPYEDPPAWRASNVQLPLYLRAVEQGVVEGVPAGQVAEISLLYSFDLRTPAGKFSDTSWRRVAIVDDGEPSASSKGPARLPRQWLDHTWRSIDEALAAMRAGPFPPEPSDLRFCQSCDYRAACPRPGGGDDDEGAISGYAAD